MTKREFFTPPEIAALLGVNSTKVLGWCRSGELRSANVSNGRRPRYRIHRDDLQAFLASRSSTPEPRRKPRRRQSEHVIEFYK